MFRRGRFPGVSRTGGWAEVGHFTQMIWPGSVRVGCALRSSAVFDYLVCRYSPGGKCHGRHHSVTERGQKTAEDQK